MGAERLQFIELSESERKRIADVAEFAEGDTLELNIRHRTGGQDSVPLPPDAAALVKDLFQRLGRGQKIAILAADKEVSPNEAASVLGMSRPLVVHRMDVGDLPFRYVGKHRRAKLSDVLALKTKLKDQQGALDDLAEETESLMRNHGL